MNNLFIFPNATRSDPEVAQWMSEHSDELGLIARDWFESIRKCGDDVFELLHDGHPTACVSNVAFAYVNVFTHHVNVGFFHGAELPDPVGLLQGSGKYMRHVKIAPHSLVDTKALLSLLNSAYSDIKRRIKLA